MSRSGQLTLHFKQPDPQAIKLDPEVQEREDERAQLQAHIIARFGGIKAAMDAVLRGDYSTKLCRSGMEEGG